MAVVWPYLNTGQIFHAEPVKLSDGLRGHGPQWPGSNLQYVSTYSLSCSVESIRFARRPHCLSHNRIISTQHCRNYWPIDLNAIHGEARLIVFMDSSLPEAQALPLCCGVYKEVISLNGGLNFFYITAPFGYHTQNHKFLLTPVTAHSNDLMPHRLNQCFCVMTIKGVCWSAVQSVRAVVWKLLLSQWGRERESQAEGTLLCSSHDPIWPVGVFWSSPWGFLEELQKGRTDRDILEVLSNMYFIMISCVQSVCFASSYHLLALS